MTFYLCFDSLAVTGCMHNTSRLWSDLSCCLGYWSHLNDGLYQESCLLPFHLGLCVQRAHASSLLSIISADTNQPRCAANKRCLPKQTKWRTINLHHQNRLYTLCEPNCWQIAPHHALLYKKRLMLSWQSLKGDITSSFPEERRRSCPGFNNPQAFMTCHSRKITCK